MITCIQLKSIRLLTAGPFLLLLIFLYLLMVYQQYQDTGVNKVYSVHNFLRRSAVQSGFVVHTPTCTIPRMEPFDPLVKKYIKPGEYLNCSSYPPLIESNLTAIWVEKSSLAARNISIDDLSCCYKPFARKLPKKKGAYTDNEVEYSSECISFTEETTITHEFIKVKCKMDKKDFYKDYHAFVVPKKSEKPSKPKSGVPNILIVGVDATSRINLHRQMPKTVKILESLNGIEYYGYNKVADNTFPNLVPVLTGLLVEELRNVCWPTDKDVFDDCPFIWKNYSSAGYKTGYGEDATWMGTFNYLKKGFSAQPVEYYLRSYIKEAEDVIGHKTMGNAKTCVGPKPVLKMLFEYALKYAMNFTMTKDPFFGFFWGGSLTHDYLNTPLDVDELHESLISNLAKAKILENTFFILMSDHGMRWGPIRETYQGRLEERLPFVYFVIPKWMEAKYPQAMNNIKLNVDRLTSPLDLHETIKDLLDLSSIDDESVNVRSQRLDDSRGISLFLQVPENRTCADAGIPPTWCTCNQVSSVAVNDSIVVKSANVLVDHVNELLVNQTQCAELKLKEILSARVESPQSNLIADKGKSAINDYILVVVTEPGEAKFEATVRHRPGDKTIKVEGYVSRINSYGTQSKCVLDFFLRLYCFCT